MKIQKSVLIFGWSLIILGLALSFIPENKEEIQQDIKPIQVVEKSERLCLIEATYHECRNCSDNEIIAISDVIINRVNHHKFPDSICKVVQQPFQFSYKNHLEDKTEIILEEKQNIISILDRKALERIENLVDDRLYSGKLSSKILPDTALFYHAKHMQKYPSWSKKMQKVKKGVDKEFKHHYYRVID